MQEVKLDVSYLANKPECHGIFCLLGVFVQVTVLKRVLDEVEKVIAEFKEKLLKSMENSNVEFTQVSMLSH
jgi:hypothetical protein